MFDLFKKKNYFKDSVNILADGGYSDRYILTLEKELSKAKGVNLTADGQSYLANAYLFRGELTKAYEIFQSIEFKKLSHMLAVNLISNMIFCLFIQDRFKQADELFIQHNSLILHEHTALMRRSLAIHEHIQQRYENAVTILIKMFDVPDPRNNLYIDICIIKSMLRLDMYERAAELSGNLESYKDKNELGQEVQKLRKKIFEKSSPKQQVKIIKSKK